MTHACAPKSSQSQPPIQSRFWIQRDYGNTLPVHGKTPLQTVPNGAVSAEGAVSYEEQSTDYSAEENRRQRKSYFYYKLSLFDLFV